MKQDVMLFASHAGASPPAPRRAVLAYGALGLPLAMAALPIYVHVPRLYAETTGMSLALLGSVLLAARLLDAVVDPLLGLWSDRVRQRQYLILLALPLLAVGMVALLQPAADATMQWLMASLLFTTFGFSLASIAYQAWGAEIGRDAHQRTRLTASREGFGLLGVVLAAALPSLLAERLDDGLATFTWLFVPLLGVLGVVSVLGAPMVDAGRRRASPGSSVFAPMWQVLSDRRFCRLLAVFVVNGVAAALPATLVLFFVADVLQADAWSGAFLALYFISGIAFLPLWVSLARRIGRMAAWVLSMGVAVAAFSWAWTLGAGDVWPFAAVCLLSGAALGADLTLPSALLADLAEAAAEKGQRLGGAYFGWWNLVAKLNLALAAGLALPLLDLAGYRPGSVGAATAGLSAIYGLLPLGFKAVAAGLAWRWRHILENTL